MLNSLSEIKAAAEKGTPHWFSPNTMRFFSSRVSEIVYPAPDGAYFVSSERESFCAPRRYTVRYCSDDGTIDTIGEFQRYATRDQAHAAAMRLAAADRAAHG